MRLPPVRDNTANTLVDCLPTESGYPRWFPFPHMSLSVSGSRVIMTFRVDLLLVLDIQRHLRRATKLLCPVGLRSDSVGHVGRDDLVPEFVLEQLGLVLPQVVVTQEGLVDVVQTPVAALR